MSAWTYSASNETNLMKIKYGKLIEKQFNKQNVILGRIKKMEDLVGKQIDRPLIQSIGGGVGNASLPTANENKVGLVKLNSSKKLYAVVQIDRETMKRARTDEGSYVRMTKFPVKIATESFNRNLTRQILKGDATGSGALLTWVTGNTAAAASGSDTVISFDNASTYDPSDFEAIEIGDILNLQSGTTGHEVIDMSVTIANGYATGSITFSGGSGTLPTDGNPTNGQIFYMQGSKDAEIVGIKGVVSATSGTYKNVSIGRRYKSYQKDASSAALSTDLLNDLVINVKRQSGESPDLLLMSYHQFIKLLNLLEDQKSYNLPARSPKYKGQISFAAVEFMSADGVIPCVPDRFMDADEVFALNTKHIELHCTKGGFEWFDEDGTVFLRDASTDSYSARYGGYAELFVNPHFQGRLHTLAR
jgi:hypothetical protein